MTTQTSETLIDPTTLLAGCGGDPVLLQKMIQSFEMLAPARLAAVRDAAQRQDGGELRLAAHNLRGLVSAFSGSIGVDVGVLEQFNIDQQPDLALRQCATVAHEIGALLESLPDVSIEELERLSTPSTGNAAPSSA